VSASSLLLPPLCNPSVRPISIVGAIERRARVSPAAQIDRAASTTRGRFQPPHRFSCRRYYRIFADFGVRFFEQRQDFMREQRCLVPFTAAYSYPPTMGKYTSSKARRDFGTEPTRLRTCFLSSSSPHPPCPSPCWCHRLARKSTVSADDRRAPVSSVRASNGVPLRPLKSKCSNEMPRDAHGENSRITVCIFLYFLSGTARAIFLRI